MLINANTHFTLDNCLFRSVKLAKNADPDKYKYSGYGIGFDSHSEFSLPDGRMGRNAINFGADMSSSVHVDNKNKNILILGEEQTQGLDDTTIKKKQNIVLTLHNQIRVVLSLHYNGSNSYVFAIATKIYQFKAKNLEVKDCALYLCNTSKNLIINNMKKTELGGVVKKFSVDSNSIDNNDILDIHKNLMKRT